MIVPTALAKIILTQNDLDYDQASKTVLATRDVAGRLMHRFIPPYRDLSVDKVMELIHGIHMTRRPLTESIYGASGQELNSGEEIFILDVSLTGGLPAAEGTPISDEDNAEFFVNLEHQRRLSMIYNLIVRGLNNGAALLVTEPRSVFPGPKYAREKPVYSIWVCPKGPDTTPELENRIIRIECPTLEQITTNEAIPLDGLAPGMKEWNEAIASGLVELPEEVSFESAKPAPVTSGESAGATSSDAAAKSGPEPRHSGHGALERFKEAAGFLNVIFLFLGDPTKTGDPTLAFLDTIYDNTVPPEIRIQQLKIKFGVQPTRELEEGIETMYSITQELVQEIGKDYQDALRERDNEITDLHNAVTARDSEITDLHNAVTARDSEITDLHNTVTDLHNTVTTRDSEIATMTTTIKALQNEVRRLGGTV